VLTYAPDSRAVAAAFGATAVLVVVAVLVGGEGAILAGAAAALLLLEGVHGAVVRPTLVADPDGLTVAHGLSHVRVPWDEVAAIRTAPLSHLVRTTALEVDTGEQVFVLTGYRLGAPPTEVAAAIDALRG
jgi:hypothetical protein